VCFLLKRTCSLFCSYH